MAIDLLIAKIKNPDITDRDLLVDELSDLFEYNQISSIEKRAIVIEMIELLATETQSDIVESIFNLLHWASIDNACSQLIAETIVQTSITFLPRLELNSLCHAFTIIAESNLPNKRRLIAPYLLSDNVAIAIEAEESIRLCDRYLKRRRVARSNRNGLARMALTAVFPTSAGKQ